MKFILSTDSCVDEYKDNLSARGIEYLPMCYCITEPVYDNFNKEEQYRAFYSSMRDGALPITSQSNPEEFETYFSALLKKYPGKDILHITLSSGLSGTYNNAVMVANEFNEKLTDNKIYVVDSLSATQGQSYLVSLAENCRSNNKSAKETEEYLNSIKHKINHFVIFNDLNHLYRGGRLNKASAIVGTILQIKPVIVFNNEGKLATFDKIKGITKGLKYLVKSLGKYCKSMENETVFIAQADAQDLAETLKQMILEEYPAVDIKIGWIGPTIGSHTSSGTIAVVFLGERRPDVEA